MVAEQDVAAFEVDPVVPLDPTRVGTPVDGVEVLGALSPSRAMDFTRCALHYRFRSVDRLPEPYSPDAVRGTLVHKVLEDLYDVPAADRTPETARSLLPTAWDAVVAEEPSMEEMFGPDLDREEWWASCHEVVAAYFDLEDPRRLEPAEREVYVEALLGSRLLLRGIVDRLDVAPDGSVRVVDYKTGRAPGEGFEAGALFQMRFYALVLWRTRGVVPRVLQLVYLGSGEVLRYEPDEDDLRATERKVEAIWAAIREAHDSGEWLPNRGPACRFCPHQAICPAWGGTPPPLPSRDAVAEGGAVVGSEATPPA
ncbi:PD-(D/E)XK nuclease family protein [Nocardioides sp. SYSU D00038]|uniref:RecB family exonuclease n=1 Tax=Nocardioides sp. SYSU D00038 TaxID=2812554 RepID=UPI001967931D|nr:PD-(D/E)XK nuclease family protein [Nocardioides sp. SYSU D00038]